MKLYEALPVAGQKHNRYCGPAAIAAMTGMNTGEAAKILRGLTGKPSVRGCHTRYVVLALLGAGLEVKRTDFEKGSRPTINQWLKSWPGTPVVLVAGNHYWALNGEHYVDSFNRRPTPIAQIRKPKAQIESVLSIWSPNDE